MPLVPVGLYGRRAVRRISPWAGYSSALATLLSEAQSSGLVLDFTQNLAFRSGTQSTITGVSGWTYTRSGTRFAGDSALTSFGANVPRIVAGSGIRVTAGATNLALQSQTFNDATWSPTNAAVAAEATTAPDGTTTADRLAGSGGGTGVSLILQAFTLTVSTTYTFSVYAKADQLAWLALATVSFTTPGDVFTYFNLSGAGTVGTTGAGHTASIRALGDGWYRCAITFTLGGADATGSLRIYLADADADTTVTLTSASSVFLWGAQLETGSTATDYIPTTTASATAGADAASVTLSGFGYPLSMIALVAASLPNATVARGAASLSDGSTTNDFNISAFDAGATAPTAYLITAGALQAFISQGAAPSVNEALRLAARAGTNDVHFARNGTLGTQDTVATVPASPTTLRIGTRGGGADPLNGYVQLVAFLPRLLTNTELQNGTA